MKILYKISAYLLVLIGIIHIAFSPVFFGQFGLDVLWFAGTGLGMVFLGNLNLIISTSEKLAFYTMGISSNLLGVLLSGVILSMLTSVQAYISMGVTLVALAGSIAGYVALIKKIATKNYTVRF
jgi:hypothetical protein